MTITWIMIEMMMMLKINMSLYDDNDDDDANFSIPLLYPMENKLNQLK